MSTKNTEALKGDFVEPGTKELGETPLSQNRSPSSDHDAQTREQRGNVYGSTDNHIFSDPVLADYWRKVYEKAKYENRHRFDPSFTWTADEEKKLVRRVRDPGFCSPR